MPESKKLADYSRFAWFYDRYLNHRYHRRALAVLEQLVLSSLPPPARILDVCCGTGHLTQSLAACGYRMTGIDASEEMLVYARRRVPGGEFIAADARDFHLPAQFEAAISTFDSLNHILCIAELKKVFRNVYAALVEGGQFVFDLNTEEAYITQWHKSSAVVKPDHAFFIRGGYNPKLHLGKTNISTFRLRGSWQRADVEFYQRCYPLNSVRAALKRSGFNRVDCYDAGRELGMSGDLGIGRAFFHAVK